MMLHLRLAGGTLLADYFGPGSEQDPPLLPGPEVSDALTATRSDTAVELAPDGRQIYWSCRDWALPDRATLAVTLQATDVPLQAALRFTIDEETGVLCRHTLLQHTGDGPPVELSHAGSMTVVMPADIREVVHLAGRWGAEAQVQRMLLPQTALLLESRSGKSGFEFLPYIALLSQHHTYFTQLCWSGNWQYYIRRQPSGRVVLAGGLNSWGFRHRLGPGDTLALPDMLLGCVAGGLNEATQQLHDYLRKMRNVEFGMRNGPNPVIPHSEFNIPHSGERTIPIQFNSWFPYQGEPPVDVMKAYATKARDLGCEVFVLDAGWYTTEQENPDEGWWLRTGDWVVDRKLFPAGLEELSAHCREQGIDFGIWIEPEAIGPSATHTAKPPRMAARNRRTNSATGGEGDSQPGRAASPRLDPRPHSLYSAINRGTLAEMGLQHRLVSRGLGTRVARGINATGPSCGALPGSLPAAGRIARTVSRHDIGDVFQRGQSL